MESKKGSYRELILTKEELAIAIGEFISSNARKYIGEYVCLPSNVDYTFNVVDGKLENVKVFAKYAQR